MKIHDNGMLFVYVVVWIAVTIFLIWLGIKGIIGMLVGMAFMAYIFLSRNVQLHALLKFFGVDIYDIKKEHRTKK